MAKEKFDDLINQGLNEKTRELEQAQIIEAFKEFQKEPTPKEVAAYEWEEGEYLIKVFKHTPPETEETLDLDVEGKGSNALKERFFSLGKILASHKESKYQPGDIVKLLDIDTLSVETSAYKAWTENPNRKGNLKQVGKEPPRFMSNIYQQYGKYSFILNPLDIDKADGTDDDCIYKIPANKVENKVKNVELLLSI